MLSKEKRLNLSYEFKAIANSGKKVQTKSFKLMYMGGENNHPLVGIAMAKQSFRKAHDRNRARRLTSRVIEQLYSKLRNDLNLVIMPKAEVIITPQEVLLKELSDVKDLYLSN